MAILNMYLFNHLKTVRHKRFLNDIVITFINKTDGCDPSKRVETLIKTLVLRKTLLHTTTTPTTDN